MTVTHTPKHTKELELVILHWEDSHGGGYWFDKADYEPEVAKCISVGMVIAETDSLITLAGSMTAPEQESGQFYAPMSIPKSCITFRQNLAAMETEEDVQHSAKPA